MKCLNFCGRWYRKGLKGSRHGHARMDILSEAKGPPEDYILSEGLGHTFTKVTRNALTEKSAVAVLCRLGLIVGEPVTDYNSLTAIE